MDQNESPRVDPRQVLWARWSAEMRAYEARRHFEEAADSLADDFRAAGVSATDAIESITQFLAEMERENVRLVAEARNDGESWEAIGNALGVSRQSAHERYANKVAEIPRCDAFRDVHREYEIWMARCHRLAGHSGDHEATLPNKFPMRWQ